MGEVFIFALTLTNCGFALVIAAYFLITLSDLECDYLNASSCCSKLNRLVLPEILMQCLTIFLLLYNSNYWLFLLNVPLLAFTANRYIGIPAGNIGLYDPTEIHNRRQLQSHMKESIAKLIYHAIFFLIYLYCLIYALFTTPASSAS